MSMLVPFKPEAARGSSPANTNELQDSYAVSYNTDPPGTQQLFSNDWPAIWATRSGKVPKLPISWLTMGLGGAHPGLKHSEGLRGVARGCNHVSTNKPLKKRRGRDCQSGSMRMYMCTHTAAVRCVEERPMTKGRQDGMVVGYGRMSVKRKWNLPIARHVVILHAVHLRVYERRGDAKRRSHEIVGAPCARPVGVRCRADGCTIHQHLQIRFVRIRLGPAAPIRVKHVQ